jgi:hypothetical protein
MGFSITSELAPQGYMGIAAQDNQLGETVFLCMVLFIALVYVALVLWLVWEVLQQRALARQSEEEFAEWYERMRNQP